MTVIYSYTLFCVPDTKLPMYATVGVYFQKLIDVECRPIILMGIYVHTTATLSTIAQ